MPAFTIETATTPRTFTYEFWNGQQLRSSRQCPLALDTETELIEDERRIPRLALAVASDGRQHVIIHPDRLADFLLMHKVGYLVGHNVQFDFWVLDQYLVQAGKEQTRRVLWDACHAGRVFDTQILDMLLQLGTGCFRKAAKARKSDDTKVYPGTLAEVAGEYTIFRISKDEPYRRRFGELLGLSQEQWASVDAGFFEYATRDAVATQRLYPALGDTAYKLMLEHGYDPRATRYQIRPDAIEKFGYLSELIQVRASIVLSCMFRRGVRVDLAGARTLETSYRTELANEVAILERDYAEVLTYNKKDGKLKLTPKGKTPSLGRKKLVPMLVKVAEEMQGEGHEIQIPMSTGKKPGVSCSIKEWTRYTELHPFLGCWARLTKLSGLLGLLAGLSHESLHGQYTLLKRTGRTSCSRPRSKELPGLNLQNVPRQPHFRALFRPAPGYTLFTGDFTAAELRTLAAVCKARYGQSTLGDVIAAGTDPHVYTGAAIQGMTLESFYTLQGTAPERFEDGRKDAKAINFGIPGGLGARALVNYAQVKYGVTLTLEQAELFKHKLINEVYPELNDRDGYLADEGMATLARNLGVTEREAWETLDWRGQRSPLAARGVANVVRGTSGAKPRYRNSVWVGLQKLARVSRSPDLCLQEQIARRNGSQALHARLYRQSALTLTGRVRAGVSYTDGKNTPFQSLCADGAKLALWNLLYVGFRVYGFVHDEIIVELPAATAEEEASRVAKIMVEAMEEVMGEAIPAACKYGLKDCWAKP
jgi:hypothetical protein